MRHTRLVALTLGVLVAAGAAAGRAGAETYIAGQAGVTFPGSFRDVEVSNGDKLSDLKLQNSFMYGLKLGHYFETLPWLGVEAEVFNTTPNVKQQTVTTTKPDGTTTTGTNSGPPRISVLTVAANLVARYPGEILQPYVGVGVGSFFSRSHVRSGTLDRSVSGTDFGLNALAGLRWMVTENIAVFGEAKYQRVQIKFDPSAGLNGSTNTYNPIHVAVGIGYHF
ncbi:outer membrane beta-barrel protein [Candidatus Nitrospira bockiana]